MEFYGRFDTSDPAGPKFSWSGSVIKARFMGTSVSVKLQLLKAGSSGYFVTLVDGALTRWVATSGSTSYSIAVGLSANTPHEVVLYKDNESQSSSVQFLGFDYGPGGALLAPMITATGPRLEFYGDSITAGYGDLGTSCTGFNIAQESSYDTYASRAARMLNSPYPTIIAKSGVGIYHNNNVNPPTNSPSEPYPTMLTTYDEYYWYVTSPRWAFPTDENLAPQIVVVNLGTNDMSKIPSTGAYPTAAEMVSAYVSFAMTLRGHYPKAVLLFAGGPLSTQYKQYIDSALLQLNDPNMKSMAFGANLSPTGCDYHPSLATHTQMASDLCNEIKSFWPTSATCQ